MLRGFRVYIYVQVCTFNRRKTRMCASYSVMDPERRVSLSGFVLRARAWENRLPIGCALLWSYYINM